MALPTETTFEDVRAICGYFATKPMGATRTEAKTVLEAKHGRPSKFIAMTFWGLLEKDGAVYKITDLGRASARQDEATRARAARNVVSNIEPYKSIIERVSHRTEGSLTTVEVGAHWHDHYADEASTNESGLKKQATCFFHIAEAAGLGTLVVGRKGSLTRFDFDKSAVDDYVRGSDEEFVPSHVPEEERMGDPPPDTDGRKDSGLGKAIFIGHGKDKKVLEQLQKILDEFKIEYLVAVDEPHLGRPISTKVRETMQACNSAILIFTADENLQDSKGNEVLRPNENVVFELGAAGYVYGDRIVILKEDGVEFASNFDDLGYISFEKGQLEHKAMDVVKELIGFDILKVTT